MSGSPIFLLVPPGEFTEHMPNMGDRALHAGMRAIWQASHDGPLVFDEWNSFPGLTWKRLSTGGRIPSDRFARIHDRLMATGRSTAASRFLASTLFGPAFFWLPIWPALERTARANTGQSGRQALEPRLFPQLAAQRFADRMAGCGAVVMNAGGLIADHLARYLPSRIFALYAALEAGKPTAVVNYTFAVSRPELLEFVAPVLRRVTLHAVREGFSRERLIDIGVPEERITVVRDSAFAAPDPGSHPEAWMEREPVITLQARGDCSQDMDAWAELAARLRGRFGVRIVCAAGCRKYDPPLIEALRRRGAHDSEVVPDSPQELKRVIGASRALVTDRYHGVVFAAQTGTPFVPLAGTTHKTAGLLQGLGYPLPARPRLEMGRVGQVVEDVEACMAAGEALSSRIGEYAASSRSMLERDYQEIVRRLADAGKHDTEKGEG